MEDRGAIERTAPPAAGGEEPEGPSLRELLDTALGGKWIIAGCAAAGLAIGVGYALFATPIYESHALVQVESQGGDVPGLEVGAWGEQTTPAETEMEILSSRRVLGQVVDEKGLQVTAAPLRFPVIGEFWARRHQGDEPAPARLGAESYGWGGERIAIERLELAGRARGQNFVLEAKGPESYALYDSAGTELVNGRVGELEEVRSENPDSVELSLVVSELRARPGTRFEVQKQSWLSAIASLRSALDIEEPVQGTGMLHLSLEGEDPEELERVLSAVASTYVREHVERRTEDAQQSLAFLEEKLPELREELNEAEEAFNEFRREEQAVDLGADTDHLLSRIVDVEAELADLELRRAEESERYTEEHPAMQTLAEKERRLRRTKADLERRVAELPEHEQEALRLQREVEVTQELYTGLLNTKHELRIAEAGTTGNVRLVDDAIRPESPVGPNRTQIGALSGVLGGLLGVGLVFGRRAMRRAVEDPETVEASLGLPVHAVIPHCAAEGRALRRATRRGAPLPLLARERPQEPAVEGLRSLRTSLHFALLGAENNRVVVTSPHPSSGKSFACINAGYVFAEAGKRALVIDADMRRGYLHEYLGRGRSPGLSEVLAGTASLDEAIATYPGSKPAEAEEGDAGGRAGRLDVLATGALPPNPSELLMGHELQALFEELGGRYDIVLVDTPPVLAATDAAVVGAGAGATLMVVRGRRSQLAEVRAAVTRLRHSHVEVMGLLFNDLGAGSAGSEQGGQAYYKYEYATAGSRGSKTS